MRCLSWLVIAILNKTSDYVKLKAINGLGLFPIINKNDAKCDL